MTNEEKELVEMMARELFNCERHVYPFDASLQKHIYLSTAEKMLSVVKANIGKIAQTCPYCCGDGEYIGSMNDAVTGERCHGTGVVARMETP